MRLLSKLRIDGFILAIIAAVVLASVLPATGTFADVMDRVVIGAIALLFFLYGARMAPEEALAGLRHWRLHLVILAFTFVAFPLIGVGLRHASSPLLGEGLAVGILYLCLVPSTVQSSIAFTSIARGNVAGAIVSASASNLVGVLLTPLLVLTLITTTGDVQISGGAIVDIVLQILLPFVVGQLSRPLTARWVTHHRGILKFTDRGTIVLVVYVAFSKGVNEGIWSRVGLVDIAVLIVGATVLVALMLWLTRLVADAMRFDRADAITVQFCGTKKSLATGLPMAAIIFAGQPVGLIVLPLMVFHQVQLMICAWLAARYGRQAAADDPPAPAPDARAAPG